MADTVVLHSGNQVDSSLVIGGEGGDDRYREPPLNTLLWRQTVQLRMVTLKIIIQK
jgi:hypothetical protein